MRLRMMVVFPCGIRNNDKENLMKKLFITFSTVAILTYNSVNVSERFDINPIHVEITDDLNNYDENDGQFVEIKHLVSEGSFTKACLDKIVEINNKLDRWEIRFDQWVKDHPYLAKTAGYALIGACLCSVLANPSGTVLMVAGFIVLRGIFRLIAQGQEYIIDSLVEKGYSEEEVTRYVCAIFGLCEKLLDFATIAFVPGIRGAVSIARANLAKFSKIGVQKAVSKRFSFSYKLQRQWKNLIEGFKHSWNAFRKFLTTPSQQYNLLKNH